MNFLRVLGSRWVVSQTFLPLKCRTIFLPISWFLAIPAVVWRHRGRAVSGLWFILSHSFASLKIQVEEQELLPLILFFFCLPVKYSQRITWQPPLSHLVVALTSQTRYFEFVFFYWGENFPLEQLLRGFCALELLDLMLCVFAKFA